MEITHKGLSLTHKPNVILYLKYYHYSKDVSFFRKKDGIFSKNHLTGGTILYTYSKKHKDYCDHEIVVF